jgi:two-component system response regulator VicR
MHVGERKVVVYIEDEPELIDLLRLILTNDKIVLEPALSGRKGLELVRQLKPDLVILDLMLPDVEGWDIYREMQEDVTLKDIPVIVITVRTEGLIEGLWPQVKQLAGYLVKPFTVHELREVVSRVLGVPIN